MFSMLPILFLMFLLPASTIPGARADQTPTPKFTTTAPVVKGYQGEGFYFAYSLNNSSHSQERLTNLTVTVDYDSFQTGISGNLTGWLDGYHWIPIPASEPPGNHSFYATASFQYLDNTTNTWLIPSNSPLQTNGTLTVLPSPASTILNQVILPIMLPAAAILAVLGILMGAFSIRRARDSPKKNVGLANSLPRRNDTLFPLASTIFFSATILAFDSLFSRVTTTLWIDANVLGFLLLTGSVGVLYTRGNYSRSSVRAVLFLSFSAAIASTFHTGTIRVASPCFEGIVGAGFPLPWAPFGYPLASYPAIAPFCPLPVIQPLIILAPLAFPLDTLIYLGIGLCIVETYRVIHQPARLTIGLVGG